MACALTQGYNLDCRDSIGGVKEVYFIELANIDSVTSAAGVISDIDTGSANFYKYNLIKQTASFEDTLTVSEENGTVFADQKLTIILNKMQANTRNEILLLAQNLLVAIVVDRNGKNFVLGLTNGLSITTAKGESGTKMGDRNGYTIEFVGAEPALAMEAANGSWSF